VKPKIKSFSEVLAAADRHAADMASHVNGPESLLPLSRSEHERAEKMREQLEGKIPF